MTRDHYETREARRKITNSYLKRTAITAALAGILPASIGIFNLYNDSKSLARINERDAKPIMIQYEKAWKSFCTVGQELHDSYNTFTLPYVPESAKKDLNTLTNDSSPVLIEKRRALSNIEKALQSDLDNIKSDEEFKRLSTENSKDYYNVKLYGNLFVGSFVVSMLGFFGADLISRKKRNRAYEELKK
ncbi:MAG: hypothetical protein WCK29_02790 [archaeon]